MTQHVWYYYPVSEEEIHVQADQNMRPAFPQGGEFNHGAGQFGGPHSGNGFNKGGGNNWNQKPYNNGPGNDWNHQGNWNNNGNWNHNGNWNNNDVYKYNNYGNGGYPYGGFGGGVAPFLVGGVTGAALASSGQPQYTQPYPPQYVQSYPPQYQPYPPYYGQPIQTPQPQQMPYYPYPQ